MRTLRHLIAVLAAGSLFVASVGRAQDAPKADPVKPAPSKIAGVTVYQNTALVTREVTVPDGVGTMEVIVSPLPPQTLQTSLYAEGTDGTRVLSTRFRTRAILIKEQRAEEVKHHLMVLWADFFEKKHFEQFPNLHQLFWDGIHGAGDVKKSTDLAVAEKLLKTIDEIADIFWQTEKSKNAGVYPPA